MTDDKPVLDEATVAALWAEWDMLDEQREAASVRMAEIARTIRSSRRTRPRASSLKPGDVIAVPPGIVRITGFRDTSRLVIKSFRATMRAKGCKACGTAVQPGDLYAASTEPTSDRCIRCVDDWPLAEQAPAEDAEENER